MISKVDKAVKEFQMLGQGDSVAVGLSGGADSVALLLYLLCRQEELSLTVSAIHINHNLRGMESQRDEEFVRTLCEKKQVPLVVRSYPVRQMAEEQGISIEECARILRYQTFEELAPKGKIATAHSRSDSVETTLFNLVRGAGAEGLTGIPPVRGRIIRPLLFVTRREIEAYLAEQGQPYVTDSSNLETEYTRNFIRLEIIPRLEQINPQLEQQVADAQQLLATDAAFLNQLAEAEQQALTLQPQLYDRAHYLSLAPALQGRILRNLLQEQGLSYDKERIATLHQLIAAGEGRQQLSLEFFCRVTQETFQWEREEKLQKEFAIPFSPMEQGNKERILVFPGKFVHIQRLDCEEIENILKNDTNALKNMIDYDKIESSLWIRSRQPGDRYQPAGRGVTKTMRKLFNEAKLSPKERSEAVLLAGTKEIYWVEGSGVSQSAALTKNSTQALLFYTIREVPC